MSSRLNTARLCLAMDLAVPPATAPCQGNQPPAAGGKPTPQKSKQSSMSLMSSRASRGGAGAPPAS
jgi:hypothetical protein